MYRTTKHHFIIIPWENQSPSSFPSFFFFSQANPKNFSLFHDFSPISRPSSRLKNHRKTRSDQIRTSTHQERERERERSSSDPKQPPQILRHRVLHDLKHLLPSRKRRQRQRARRRRPWERRSGVHVGLKRHRCRHLQVSHPHLFLHRLWLRADPLRSSHDQIPAVERDRLPPIVPTISQRIERFASLQDRHLSHHEVRVSVWRFSLLTSFRIRSRRQSPAWSRVRVWIELSAAVGWDGLDGSEPFVEAVLGAKDLGSHGRIFFVLKRNREDEI